MRKQIEEIWTDTKKTKSNSGRKMSEIIGVSGQKAAAPSRAQRAATLLQVTCSVLGGAFFKIRVRNLSGQGLVGICLQKVDLYDGQCVTIGFRNVSPISAHVAWVTGNEVGIEFQKPIDLALISDARSWSGPGFSVHQNHEIASVSEGNSSVLRVRAQMASLGRRCRIVAGLRSGDLCFFAQDQRIVFVNIHSR
jgi:hypothetical protein